MLSSIFAKAGNWESSLHHASEAIRHASNWVKIRTMGKEAKKVSENAELTMALNTLILSMINKAVSLTYMSQKEKALDL
jgi:hypothetical protein